MNERWFTNLMLACISLNLTAIVLVLGEKL
jgi:hypothetical protein